MEDFFLIVKSQGFNIFHSTYFVFSGFNEGNLHSTLRVVTTVFGGLLLFVVLQFKVLLLSCRFPVSMIEVLLILAVLVIFVDPRYQVIVGVGTALLLTTHWTSIWVPSLNVRGLSLGTKDTLWTSTVFVKDKN